MRRNVPYNITNIANRTLFVLVGDLKKFFHSFISPDLMTGDLSDQNPQLELGHPSRVCILLMTSTKTVKFSL
jgi:hypothetical protein